MLDQQNYPSEAAIACNPRAIDTDRRDDHEAVVKDIFSSASVLEVKELPNGYGFRLPSDAAMLMTIAEDLTLDRLCCPFLLYTLEIALGGGPFWLSFTGPEGTKDFLWFSFEESGILNEAVAKAAGFNVSASKALDSVQTALEMTERINARTAQFLNSDQK